MHFRYFINLIIPHEPTFFYFLSSVRNSKGLLSIKFLCVTLPHMSIPSRNPAHSFQKSRAFLSGILRIPFRNLLEIHVCCSLLPESVLYWVQRRNGCMRKRKRSWVTRFTRASARNSRFALTFWTP